MKLKPVGLVLAIAGALLAGCNQTTSPTTDHKAREVGIVVVKTQPYTLITQLPGRTVAYRSAEVRPQVNGIIQKRLFTEGSVVKAGQQLYQIDPAVYASNLKSAQATLASARSLAERYKDLISDHAVSRQAYDESQASLLSAEAAVDRARIDLAYTKLVAPVSGRIGRSAVTEGALVSSGQAAAMATIQQLDPIYVDVTQSSKDLLLLRDELESGRLQTANGGRAKVKLILENDNQYSLEGTMEFSEVSVDEGTGSVTLRAVFANPEHVLLPGMFVRAQLGSAVNLSAILVPQQGVTRNQKGDATALVVGTENRVESRKLKAERTFEHSWLISGGLNPGDKLITEGVQFIKPGDIVTTYEVKSTDIKNDSTSMATSQSEADDV